MSGSAATADRPYRRYVDTSEGQLHVTESGTGLPLVLLPWFPFSARLYAGEFATLANAGCRVLGVDLMGLGRSGPRERGWNVERHAAVIAEALATLGAEAAVLVGGHLGAQVAVELAHRVAARGLVLDGGPFLSAEAVAALRARVRRRAGPGLQADGSHRSFLWDHAVDTYRIFDPAFEADAARLPLVYGFVADYLAAGLPTASDVPDGYPMAERLAALHLPTLVLSAETDPLRDSYEPLLRCARQARGHLFAGGHPLHDPGRGGEYGRVIGAWVAAVAPHEAPAR